MRDAQQRWLCRQQIVQCGVDRVTGGAVGSWRLGKRGVAAGPDQDVGTRLLLTGECIVAAGLDEIKPLVRIAGFEEARNNALDGVVDTIERIGQISRDVVSRKSDRIRILRGERDLAGPRDLAACKALGFFDLVDGGRKLDAVKTNLCQLGLLNAKPLGHITDWQCLDLLPILTFLFGKIISKNDIKSIIQCFIYIAL